MPGPRPPVELVPYHPPRHEAFVCSSWVAGAGRPRELIRGHLRRPDVKAAVAQWAGHPDDLLGWAAVKLLPGGPAVVWCYVVQSNEVRTRGAGLMTSLLVHLGVDVATPTPCLFWSRAAADIASKGEYRVYYDPWGWTRRPRPATPHREDPRCSTKAT